VGTGLIYKLPKIEAISTDLFPTSGKRPESSKLGCNIISRSFGFYPDDWLNQKRLFLK
jgi:dTDP-4-dehydrorhamnose reductase